MIRFLFVLIAIFILILFCQRVKASLGIFRLKNKIKHNPFIGIRQQDNSYYYKAGGYAASYRIEESPNGIKTVEWIFLRRRLTFFEEKIIKIKRRLNNLFLYQRWITLFRPSMIIILIISLIIFYFGIKEQSLKRIERFRWIAAQITGLSPESIEYTEGGWFKISGQRKPLDKKTELVTISFNPLGWLFFFDTARITRWNEESNKYNSYSITINDKGDVWLRKKSVQFHGTVAGNKVVWDEPPDTARRVSGIDVTTKDSRVRFIDE